MTEKLQREFTLTLGQLTAICGTFLIPGLVAVFMFAGRVTKIETQYDEHIKSFEAAKLEIKNEIQAGDAANAEAIKTNKLLLDNIGEQVGNVRVDVARIAASTAK